MKCSICKTEIADSGCCACEVWRCKKLTPADCQEIIALQRKKEEVNIIVTIEMANDEEIKVHRGGEEIMCFHRDENLGDIYYDLINLLKALDIKVEES